MNVVAAWRDDESGAREHNRPHGRYGKVGVGVRYGAIGLFWRVSKLIEVTVTRVTGEQARARDKRRRRE